MLQLAGAGSQDDMDGQSLVPLLTAAAPWRSDFFLEFHGTYSFGSPNLDTLADVQQAIAANGSINLVPTFRAVRSDQWLYVEWYSGTVHEYELYDMNADPGQLDNLVATLEGAQQYADVTSALQTRLEQLAVCAGCVLLGVTGTGAPLSPRDPRARRSRRPGTTRSAPRSRKRNRAAPA